MYALVAAVLMLLYILHVLPWQLALALWLLMIALQLALGWWPFNSINK
jgi:hypothetical protein